MNIWTLDDARKSTDLSMEALTRLISHFGSQDFSAKGIEGINIALAVGSWSVYRVNPALPPVCYLSGSFRRRDTTASCFQVYRERLYQRDRTFDIIGGRSNTISLKALHLTAQDVQNPEHRSAIYEQHRIRERLSVAKACDNGSILSVNLYRHADQSTFHDRDLQVFSTLAPSLFTLVERQITVTEQLAGKLATENNNASHSDSLLRCAPELTRRELDVCLRLLQGMTHDGIACDLGISPATVKTYRNRAFDRLAIHHNNELFALVLRRAAPSVTS